MTFTAATLTIGAIAAAFAATLLDHHSTSLYIVCAVLAAAGLALMLLLVVRRRQDPSLPRYALAPMAIVVALLGVAASGASCGVACIAWGAPAAAATLAAPDLRAWLNRKRPLKRV